jgi:hypothetical protein
MDKYTAPVEDVHVADQRKCICGVGEVFYSHMHEDGCPCAQSWNAPPPSAAEAIRAERDEAVAELAKQLPGSRWADRHRELTGQRGNHEAVQPMPLAHPTQSMDADG